MKSEYAEWRAEIDAKANPKPTLAERIKAAWGPKPQPDPDVYAWRDVADLFEDRR